MTDLIQRLRARTIAVPKEGAKRFTPPPGFYVTCTIGGESPAHGTSAGIQYDVQGYNLSGSSEPQQVCEHVWITEPLLAEAADEIERLTHDVAFEQLRVAAKDKEIDRLRAALERIADRTYSCVDACLIEVAQEIAREALAGPKNE